MMRVYLVGLIMRLLIALLLPWLAFFTIGRPVRWKRPRVGTVCEFIDRYASRSGGPDVRGYDPEVERHHREAARRSGEFVERRRSGREEAHRSNALIARGGRQAPASGVA